MGRPGGAVIRESAKGPKWFNLEKYERAADLDTTGWLYQIGIRRELEFLWPCPDSDTTMSDDPTPEFADDWVYGTWKKIEERGVLPVPGDPEKWVIRFVEFDDTSEDGYAALRTLTNNDAYGFLLYSPNRKEIEDCLNGNRIYLSQHVGKGKPGPVKRWEDQIYKPYGPLGALLGVDLSRNDKELKFQFAEWLKYARKELGTAERKREITPHDLVSWAKESVLPHWDLTFWAERHRQHFSPADLDDILFPLQRRRGGKRFPETPTDNLNRAKQSFVDLRVQVMRELGIKRRA